MPAPFARDAARGDFISGSDHLSGSSSRRRPGSSNASARLLRKPAAATTGSWPAPTAVRNTFLPKSMRPCGASVHGRLVGLTTRNRWNIRLPASWPWRWPGFVPEMQVWIGLFGRCSVRRTCLRWSPACSPAAGFRTPAGARVPSLCWPKEKEPREMAYRARRLYKPCSSKGGNRQDTSCSTNGHTAPSPSTEAREGVSRRVALRSLPPD
jgi:hypothetical protein